MIKFKLQLWACLSSTAALQVSAKSASSASRGGDSAAMAKAAASGAIKDAQVVREKTGALSFPSVAPTTGRNRSSLGTKAKPLFTGSAFAELQRAKAVAVAKAARATYAPSLR